MKKNILSPQILRKIYAMSCSMIFILSMAMIFCSANILAESILFKHKAQANTIEKILDDVEENYAQMKSFKANFSQELFHRESNNTQKRIGELLFEQSNNIRWQTKRPYAEEIIVNKKEIWNYLPDEEIAYKYGPEMLESSHIALSVITGNTKIMDNFEVETLKHDAELTKLRLYPFEPNTNLVEAELWIDTKKNLIKKIIISDFYSNTNTILFDNFSPNVKVRNTDFTFTPPKGITVEDLSK